MTFAKSFSTYFAQTVPLIVSESTISFSCGYKVLASCRISIVSPFPYFVVFRNFSKSKEDTFKIKISRKGSCDFYMNCKLPFKRSFIGLGGYTGTTGPKLLLATLPVYLKMSLPGGEDLWVIQTDNYISGELAFLGNVKITGNLGHEVHEEERVSILFCKIQGMV